METKNIFFVTIKDSQDKPINPTQKGEIEQIILWIEKKIKNEGNLITSPVCECLDYCSAIFDKVLLEKIVVEELTNKKDLVSSINPKEIRLEKIANYESSKDIEILIDFINKNYNFAIIVIEDEVFNEFKLECRSRNAGFSSLHIFSIQKENKHDQALSHFKTTFKNIFEEQLFKLFCSKSSEIIQKFEETKEEVEKIPKNVKNLVFNCFDAEDETEDESESQQIENLSKKVEKLSEQISLSTKTINYYLELANCYVNTKVPTEKLIISSFCQQKTTNLWKLKIRNSTSEDFRQVDVFIAEKSQKICSFSLIQNQSIVYKFLSLGNDFLYDHKLIAVVADEVVSDPFEIFPIKLSIKGQTQEKVCLKVENQAITKIFGFMIVSTKSAEPIFIHENSIKSRETVYTEQVLADFGEVFVVSEKKKISNSLVF